MGDEVKRDAGTQGRRDGVRYRDCLWASDGWWAIGIVAAIVIGALLLLWSEAARAQVLPADRLELGYAQAGITSQVHVNGAAIDPAPPAQVKEVYWWVNHSVWGGTPDRIPLITALHASQSPTLKIHPLIVFGGHFELDRRNADGTVFEAAKRTWDAAEKLGLQPVACLTLWPRFAKDYPADFGKAVLTQEYWDTLATWPGALAKRLGVGPDRICVDAEPYGDAAKIVRAWYETPGFDASWNAFLLQELCRQTWARHGKLFRYYLPGRMTGHKPYGFYNSISQLGEVNLNEQDYRPNRTPISTDDEIPGAWLAAASDPFYRPAAGDPQPLFTAESFLKDRLPMYRRHFVYVDYSLVGQVGEEFKAARAQGPGGEVEPQPDVTRALELLAALRSELAAEDAALAQAQVHREAAAKLAGEAAAALEGVQP